MPTLPDGLFVPHVFQIFLGRISRFFYERSVLLFWYYPLHPMSDRYLPNKFLGVLDKIGWLFYNKGYIG